MATLDVDKLEDILEEAGIKQSDFVNRLYELFDIRKDTARTWFRGVRNPKDDAIQQMASLLHVDPNVLVKDGYIEPAITSRIAKVPMLLTHTNFHIDKGLKDDDILKKIRFEAPDTYQIITDESATDIFALGIRHGDSNPPIPYGATVICKFGMEEITDNSIVVVQQQLGILYLRRVKFYSGEIKLFDLRDDELIYPKDKGDSEKILGVVIKVEYPTPYNRGYIEK